MQAQVVILAFFVSRAASSILEPVIENVVHLQASHPPDIPGLWKKRMIWKPRWVQEWKTSKTWKPVWRKVWSPVEIREWVPIPKPPPTESTPLSPVPSHSGWSSSDADVLLDSYHTIRDVPPTTPKSENFLDPPKADALLANYQQPIRNSTKLPPFKPVSPYAAQLADAVVKQKQNQILNVTERPSGLTDIIYKSPETTTNRPSKLSNVTPRELFIVTPVPFG